MQTKIKGVSLKSDIEIPENEALIYVNRGKEKYGDGLRGIDIKVDADENFINIYYDIIPFTRLRRITGYLAPTNKWNDAKMHELNDRTMHNFKKTQYPDIEQATT